MLIQEIWQKPICSLFLVPCRLRLSQWFLKKQNPIYTLTNIDDFYRCLSFKTTSLFCCDSENLKKKLYKSFSLFLVGSDFHNYFRKSRVLFTCLWILTSFKDLSGLKLLLYFVVIQEIWQKKPFCFIFLVSCRLRLSQWLLEVPFLFLCIWVFWLISVSIFLLRFMTFKTKTEYCFTKF